MSSSTAVVSQRGRRSQGLLLGDVDRDRAFRRARLHSLLVRTLRVGLPIFALGLCTYYGVSLKLAMGGIGGVTMSAPPTLTSEGMAMSNPRYEGFNKDGGKFVVMAKTATQDLRDRNAPVKLAGISGQLLQPDKTVTNLKAKLGSFDSKQNQLELYDGIEITSQTGMRASLTRATVLTKEQRIVSREPVMVEMATGSVSGRQMEIDQKTRQVSFLDGVAARVKSERKTGSVPGSAQKGFGSSDEPVDITATRLDVDDGAKTAVFKGGVRAVQADSILETAELEVSYEGTAAPGAGTQPRQQAEQRAETAQPAASSVKRIVSRVPVVLTQGTDRVTGDSADFDAQNDTAVIVGRVVMTSGADRKAQSDRAELDQRSDAILLSGSVFVQQGKNELRGRRLWVDRKAGRAQLTAPAEAGRGAGRIATKLYQGDGKQPAGGAKKAASAPAEAANPMGFGTFRTDPNAPIDIEAVSLDVDDTAKKAIYRGDVRVAQADFKLVTPELTAFFTGQMGLNLGPGQAQAPAADSAQKAQAQLTRIEARRGVSITSKDGQTATGEWADFDTKANTAVLGGDVKLTQGQTVLRGSKLLIDMNTGESRLMTDPSVAAGDAAKRGAAGSAIAGAAAAAAAAGLQAKDGKVSVNAQDAQSVFTPQASGRPRMVLYPNQFKGMGKAGAAAPAAGGAPPAGAPPAAVPGSPATPAAQPAQPAAAGNAEAAPRKRREGLPADATSIFAAPGGN
jgi:LPS export ABC transporter protein LptC